MGAIVTWLLNKTLNPIINSFTRMIPCSDPEKVTIEFCSDRWLRKIIERSNSTVYDIVNNRHLITRGLDGDDRIINVHDLKRKTLLQQLREDESVRGITKFQGRFYYWTPVAFYRLKISEKGKLSSEIIHEFGDYFVAEAVHVVKEKNGNYELRIMDNLRNVFRVESPGIEPVITLNGCSILLGATKNAVLFFRKSKQRRHSGQFIVMIGSLYDSSAVNYDLVLRRMDKEETWDCFLRTPNVNCCESVVHREKCYTLFLNNVALIVDLGAFKVDYGLHNNQTFILREGSSR